MRLKILRLLTCWAVLLCSQSFAQNLSGDESVSQSDGVTSHELGKGAVPGGDEIEDTSKRFEKLENFDKLKNPPLSMGDTGDRVRELQATLNYVLGGEVIKLRYDIFVDVPEPESAEAKDQRRLAFSEHRNKAFQIRGDWLPAANRHGDPITGETGDHLQKVKFLK